MWPLRGLSLSQPYASLVAAGLKDLETRGKRTSYRGHVLICAAVRGSIDGVTELFGSWPTAALALPRVHDWGTHFVDMRFPTGCALAIARISDCRPLQPEDEPRAFFYAPGRWAWVLAEIRRVKPTHVRGMLGLFPLPSAVTDHLEIAT